MVALPNRNVVQVTFVIWENNLTQYSLNITFFKNPVFYVASTLVAHVCSDLKAMQPHCPLHAAPSWWSQREGRRHWKSTVQSGLAVCLSGGLAQGEGSSPLVPTPAPPHRPAPWAAAVGGALGAAKPVGCGYKSVGPAVPSARARLRPHHGAPEAAGFPVPSPRRSCCLSLAVRAEGSAAPGGRQSQGAEPG